MELVKLNSRRGAFFPQYEFELIDDETRVCHLMAMEVVKGQRLDLTVMTDHEYQDRDYASQGLKMLIEWAINHNYKEVTLTNLFGSGAIDRIAEKLHFQKDSDNTWNKSIVGPLNI